MFALFELSLILPPETTWSQNIRIRNSLKDPKKETSNIDNITLILLIECLLDDTLDGDQTEWIFKLRQRWETRFTSQQTSQFETRYSKTFLVKFP